MRMEKMGTTSTSAKQHAAGQPITRGSAKAVQLNPKTGGLKLIDSNTIQMIDKNTGIRPSAAKSIDPYRQEEEAAQETIQVADHEH